MGAFFVVFLLIALFGLFWLGGNGLFCGLLLLAALAGAGLSLILKGRKRVWMCPLAVLCLVFCLFMGQSAEGGIGEYNEKLCQAAEKVERGELDEGIGLLDELDAEYGLTDRSLYVRAEGWLSVDEYGEALRCVNKVQDQKDRRWYGYMERIYAVEGTEKELENLYLTGAEELPEDGYMQYMAGLVRLGAGAYDSAEYYFRRALRLNEKEALSCYYLGVICQEQGRTREAGQYFEEAKKQGVDDKKEAYIEWYLENGEKPVTDDGDADLKSSGIQTGCR